MGSQNSKPKTSKNQPNQVVPLNNLPNDVTRKAKNHINQSKHKFGGGDSNPDLKEDRSDSYTERGLKTAIQSTDGELSRRTKESLHKKNLLTLLTLDQLLRNTQACKRLRKYLEALGTKGAQNLLLNSLLFWIEVEDYSSLPKSEFRAKRATEICNRYLSPFSSNPIQSEQLEKEELQQELCESEIPNENIFHYFQTQCYSLLLTEVFEPFKLIYEKEISREIEEKAAFSHMDAFETTTEKIEMGRRKVMMEKILNSNRKCFFFKQFLQRVGGTLEHFLFYLDVNEFYNMFCAMRQEQKDNEQALEIDDPSMKEREKALSREFFLTQASKIYDKYIRKGSLQQVVEDTDIAKAVVDRLGHWDGEGEYPYDVFNLPSNMSLTTLSDNYLDQFLASDEYKQYETEADDKKNRRLSHHDFQLLTNITTKAVHTITEILINQNLCQMFESSIKNPVNGNMVRFYKEVQEYKAIPMTRKDYIMARARKIYVKYIQRGSKQELNVDEAPKKAVRSKIGLASECKPKLFDNLTNEVIQVLENEEYFGFLQNATYLQFLETNHDLEDTYLTDVKIECPIDFDTILNDSHYCRYFESYLSAQFYDACIYFWIDVEDFMRVPKSQLQIAKGKKIYQRYLAKTARQPVTVSQAALNYTEKYLKQGASPRMFQKAKEEVYSLMKDTLYPSFTMSDQCAELIKMFNTEKKQKRDTTYDIQKDVTKKILVVHNIGDVLHDSVCSNYFKMFCVRKETQNLFFFWIEAEEYKYIPDTGFLKVKSNKIFNKYIISEGKMHITLPDDIVEKITESYKTPTPALFLPAQKHSETLMESEFLDDFLASEEYTTFQSTFEQRLISAPPSPRS